MKYTIDSRPAARVAALLLLSSPAISFGQATNPCDLTSDGSVTAADVNAVVAGAIGQAACTANVVGASVCDAAAVQRVVNAAQGGSCVAGNPHSVALTWTASSSATVVGYNVYRSTSTGGPYAKITTSPVAGTAYTDTTVQAGQAYSYVLTSVDDLGNESSFSGLATASIPFP